ncbi:MAG TPA: ABC transporter permease [Mycobacteriales bacterium]|nr:ABC transporter permease [Mycobacteriales bacterium]
MGSAPPSTGALVPQLDLSGSWASPARLLRQLWASRDLCRTLARKDFFVRYRRATFGVLWAVALPAFQATVLSIVLSRVTRFNVAHYPAYIFSGMIGWTYFSAVLGGGATSIVDNASLSSKIYFPRAVLPIAVCLSNLFALSISVAILIVFATAKGATPGLHSLWLLVAVAAVFLMGLSLTLLVSAVHVYFRDATYAVQAALLAWFYITPVFYPISLLHGAVRRLVEINPLTGVIETFHQGAVGGPVEDPYGLLISAAWSVGLLMVAVVLHCRFERSFADLM